MWARGRFGLNLVCGWNEGEFEMFGVKQRDHETRYAYAQEWIDIVKAAWTQRGRLRLSTAQFFDLKGARAHPKPMGGVTAADHERGRLRGRSRRSR